MNMLSCQNHFESHSNTFEVLEGDNHYDTHSNKMKM